MLSLRHYIEQVQEAGDVVHVEAPVDPAKFEVTALLQNLENAGRYPMVMFHRPLNLHGEVSEFPLVTNVFAARERCAQALGMQRSQAKLEMSLEYARREDGRVAPVTVGAEEAPIKEVVRTGEDVDLRDLPIVRHHHMDPAPYIDMAPMMRDPDSGAYNIAYLRMMYKGPRKLGLHMSPRHNWQITRKHEERNQPTPVVVVVSHHPAFFLGGLNVAAFGEDDYELIGSIAAEPIRVVPSETWGEDFMVPAEADIVIEGEVPPNVREVEGPFGEFPGTYGPQRLRWIIDVKAISHRRDAIYQDIFVGHPDDRIQGGIPKEGRLYNRIRGVVPTCKAVALPPSGVCRFHCYISIDKRVDGESKQAALIALGEVDFIKHVVVVDGDIDPFDEQQVLWAIATRVQADQDVDIIKNVKGNTLDPSQIDDIMTTKMIIDATRPVRRPFAERIEVPADVLKRMALEDYISDLPPSPAQSGISHG